MTFMDRRAAAARLPHRPRSRPPLWPLAVAGLVGAAATAWHAWSAPNADDLYVRGGFVAELAAEVKSAPGAGPRLTIGSVYRPCARPGADPEDCEAGPRWLSAPHLETSASRAALRTRQATDPDAAHAIALIDLVMDRGEGKSLGRSIHSLRRVARVAQRPAPALADLSAAYLLRAAQTGAPRDLLAALDAAEEAMRLEPRNAVALYNRALAMQQVGLVAGARRGWSAYLAVDTTSAWAGRARAALREASARPTPPPVPAADAPLDAYARYAGADPQGARTLGFNRLLLRWGDAVLASDTAGAGAALARAAALGDALERRPGGDGTLADAVRAIRSSRSAGARQALARAHGEYARGGALYDSLRFGEAERRFHAAAAGAAASPALRGWARMFLGTARVQRGDPAGGAVILREVLATADEHRHPALAARAGWSLAGTLLRTDQYSPAVQMALRGAALFGRAGERENEGTLWQLVSDAQFREHDPAAGYGSAGKALRILREYPGSLRLHNLCVSLAEAAAADTLRRAALRIQDEGVEAAGGTGEAAYFTEALVHRALLAVLAGDTLQARRDVVTARAALERVRAPGAKAWMTADLGIAAAMAWPRRADAVAELDAAIGFFGGLRIPQRAFPAVVAAARAKLAAGDRIGAAVRMEAAFRMLEWRRRTAEVEVRRAAVFNEARELVERLVMLRLAAGRTGEALEYMDRGRASLAPAGPHEREGASAIRVAPGEVAVEFALIGDTLVAWTVSAESVTVARTGVDREALTRAIERLRGRMERQAGAEALHEPLAELHRWLIAPVRARLGGPGMPLVIVADGVLAQVPFAALRPSGRARYLVQDHPLRLAVSLREPAAPPGPAAAGAAVLVADPAFEPDARSPGLERLPGAAAEVGALAAGYPGARVLAGGQATRSAVAAAFQRAPVVHYAGHAVFDDEQPERSYLLLAPEAGAPGNGRLTASELARMDLRRVSLVVLSACETVRTGAGHADGLGGLAGALLAAGAGGVVGTVWKVDDRSTLPLMVAFHRAYRATGNGPRALRAAQLQMLGSQDPALRSPAAWAGFQYTGR